MIVRIVPDSSKMQFLLFLILSLITFASANTDLHTTSPKLDPAVPIYLGHVFWPPTMTFIAWLPSEDNTLLEWCYKATDVSDHRLFSLGGVDALQIHDYFFDQAYITKEGEKFAECSVTPESGRIGACQGVLDWECDGGHKFTGPGTRTWSCWVIEKEKRKIYEK
jgi:hypothetical protein